MMTNNKETQNKRVYVTIGDIYRNFENNILSISENLQYKNFLNSIGAKKQLTILMLIISDIVDRKIVLSKGIILEHESVLIPYIISQGLNTIEAQTLWWVIYDSIKEIVDSDQHTVINSGIRVGQNFCLNLKNHKALLENV